jgi:hypothetical protein
MIFAKQLLPSLGHTMRTMLSLSLMLFPAVLLAQVEPRVEVSGKVVNSATMKPVPGALVVLASGYRKVPATSPGSGNAAKYEYLPVPAQRVLSDEEGGFSFLTEQTFPVELGISRRGYRSETNQDVAEVSLNFNEAQGAIVKLVHLGVVHGRVTNPYGESLQGISVALMRMRIVNGRRFLPEIVTAGTDDRGEFRIWSVRPGKFYLKAIGIRQALSGVGYFLLMSRDDEAYIPVYYPSAPNQNSARSSCPATTKLKYSLRIFMKPRSIRERSM